MTSTDLSPTDLVSRERIEGLDTQTPLVLAQSRAASGRMDVISLTTRKCPHRLSQGFPVGFLRIDMTWSTVQGASYHTHPPTHTHHTHTPKALKGGRRSQGCQIVNCEVSHHHRPTSGNSGRRMQQRVLRRGKASLWGQPGETSRLRDWGAESPLSLTLIFCSLIPYFSECLRLNKVYLTEDFDILVCNSCFLLRSPSSPSSRSFSSGTQAPLPTELSLFVGPPSPLPVS